MFHIEYLSYYVGYGGGGQGNALPGFSSGGMCTVLRYDLTDRVHPLNVTASASPTGGGGRSAVQLLSGEDIASAGGGGGGSNCLQSTGCGGGGKSLYDLHGNYE
jgi:hypothetical protein